MKRALGTVRRCALLNAGVVAARVGGGLIAGYSHARIGEELLPTTGGNRFAAQPGQPVSTTRSLPSSTDRHAN